MTQKEYEGRMNLLVRISAGLAMLLFLYYAYSIVTTVMLLVGAGPASGGLAAWLSAALMTAWGILILVLTLRIVWSLRGAQSPFTVENAKRLRVIGCLLIAYELIMAVLARLPAQGMRIAAADGSSVQVAEHSSMGGILIIVGLAVLAISVVFQYGVELQQLSDETL